MKESTTNYTQLHTAIVRIVLKRFNWL